MTPRPLFPWRGDPLFDHNLNNLTPFIVPVHTPHARQHGLAQRQQRRGSCPLQRLDHQRPGYRLWRATPPSFLPSLPPIPTNLISSLICPISHFSIAFWKQQPKPVLPHRPSSPCQTPHSRSPPDSYSHIPRPNHSILPHSPGPRPQPPFPQISLPLLIRLQFHLVFYQQ